MASLVSRPERLLGRERHFLGLGFYADQSPFEGGLLAWPTYKFLL